MRIEEYFAQLISWIEECPLVERSEITFQARKAALGFVRGEIFFQDGSLLHLREFVDVEHTVDRITYAYQYMDANRHLLFRYDNAAHHSHRPTHPHRKHDGSEEHVIASPAPTLAEVLAEIEKQIWIP